MAGKQWVKAGSTHL
ncbi:KxYKxGKxW signal peptide domain-containing protein [Thermofilum sp.]